MRATSMRQVLAASAPSSSGPCRRPRRCTARRPVARAVSHVACVVAAEREASEVQPSTVETVPVVFQCFMPVAFGDHLRVVGSHELLGCWDVAAAPTLEWSEGHVWTATLDLPVGAELEYKFVHIMPHRGGHEWEYTPNRSLLVAGGSPLAVSTQWNNPMAEYEARAIAVQAPEALDLLEALEVGGPSGAQEEKEEEGDHQQQQAQPAQPPAPSAGAAAVEAPLAPAPHPHFHEGANYDADVESMFSADMTYSSLEDVSAVLAADPAVAEMSLSAAAASAAGAAAAPAEAAPANGSASASAASLLKTVGKTAGFVAMGVAAGALMSALTVDVAEVAVMGAVMAAAGNAALTGGPSKGGKAEDGSNTEEGEAPRPRIKSSEPAVFVAASVLTALDKVSSALSSIDAAADSEEAVEEKKEK